jgi:hypothetical protein
MEIADIEFTLWPDVLTEVSEHLPALERDLHRLVQQPQSPELLSSAFRHLHTIKGDFGYCRATPLMNYVHKMEGVLQSLREGRFMCSPFIAEALLQSMDQVPEMMESLTRTRQYDGKSRDTLVGLIEQLALAGSQDQADQIARHILLSAHGAYFEDAPSVEQVPAPSAESYARALALGGQLSAALVVRMPDWSGRVAMQLDLVMRLNQQYRNPIRAESLKLAVYWHDVGMLQLPDRLWQAAPKPKTDDWKLYAEHPGAAANWLLAVAPDCTEAAQIIRQHHQWANGFGIRAAEYEGPTHAGAMMLACADLLHERVAGLRGEDYRRGVLRAVFDVNGGLDSHFDASVINAFQAIARDIPIPE